jgi:hypothetical protein
MQTEAFESIVSFGQYLHWSQMQFDHFRAFNEESNDADYIGALAHWIASVYVAAEAWHELGLSDSTISSLITKYDDIYKTMRRFRNAVYHFQPKPMSMKLTDFLAPGAESNPFARALQFELQRFLVSSVSNDSIGAEIRLTIGWWPSDPLVLFKAGGGRGLGEVNPAIAFLTRLRQKGA